MLETASLYLMLTILLPEADVSFEKKLDGQIDTYDVLDDDDKVTQMSTREVEKLKTCMGLEEDQRWKEDVPMMINGWIMEEEERRQRTGSDSG